ncbi:SLC13 family permease [Lujinxingia litoralis]|uniref:SLC13 family permease n=1 Tax=Lujinxingia litoralis TaxID=2211119 RepID=A0A328C7H0_9DELT|nr:SLC13 family permease [Lujinxingia litoralis]RAL22350.1 SLC13 family permease [Lujinxingia litoralis]
MESLTPDMITVLVILASAIYLFVSEIVRIDVAAIIIMVAVGLTGLVSGDQLFNGFASNAVISIIAVMILGAALDRVGIMRRVAAFLLKVGGRTEGRIISLISGSVAAISAFMQNIGAAALFLPVSERLAERTGISVSRILMPMGFAAILGGTMTLVASGPLILLNDLLAASSQNLGVEIEPLGLFTPTPIGIALTVAGIAMFAIAGKWLLPSNTIQESEEARDLAATYGIDQTIHAFAVGSDSPLCGDSVEAIEAQRQGIVLLAIARDGELTPAPTRDFCIQQGDVLAILGPAERIEHLAQSARLTPTANTPFAALHDDQHAGLAEVLVRPGSDVVGKKVVDLRLRAAFGVTVLGIHRRGELLIDDVRQIVLDAGDVLVLFTPWERLQTLAKEPPFVVLSDYPAEPARTHKTRWALLAFGLALGLVIFSSLKLSLALMVGAVIVLITGVLTADEAYRAVSWKTVFLLAALIPLGQAVEDTGTAAWIAERVIGLTEGFPTWGVQLTIALLATAFTLTISNVGATVLLVPLAANVAVGVGADPAQFGLIVALAASNAFLLPTHQVNALLMGPGGYRVKDFLKAGTAMTVLFTAVLIGTINIFF